jgi:BASS family bile acid:Na+ symporter
MQAGFMTQVALPLVLAFIMLGMGMSLVTDDFRRVLQYPRAVALGLFGQLVLLPVVGFAIASLFPLTPELAVGLMILTACAGGATSNLIVYMAKGDTALSVTLTAFSSCFTVLTIPFVVNFALRHFMAATDAVELPVGVTNLQLFVITLAPVLLGMLVRRRWPAFSIRTERHVSKVAGVFLALLVVGILLKNRDILGGALVSAGPASLTLNAATMAAGFGLATAFGLNQKQRVAISVEVGVQNSATGMFIATTLLHRGEMALMPAVYSLAMYLNAGLLISWMSRRQPA